MVVPVQAHGAWRLDVLSPAEALSRLSSDIRMCSRPAASHPGTTKREAAVTVARGVQHKYPDTAVLLCSEAYGAYCRHCFRKRLFVNDNAEATNEVLEGIRYVKSDPEITDILLTSGDPLLMSTGRLVEIFETLHVIPHLRIVRIGSKTPAFDPWRILDDEQLQAAFRKCSTPRCRIYLVAHFDHPRELTNPAVEAIQCCIRSGVICANQFHPPRTALFIRRSHLAHLSGNALLLDLVL